VLLELDPDSYVVVALEVYPPSIAVLDPDVLVCVDPANAAEVSSNNIINIRGFFILKFRL
jgi:Pyruvate/2-oxoacid:ferredoxin oxidoreductase gamma subunit